MPKIAGESACGVPLAAIDRLTALLRSDARIKAAWLYGSRALGTHRPASDIDLCLDAPGLAYAELAALESRIDDLLLPWQVDLSLLHQIDNPELLDHIRRVGVDLFASSVTGA